jgi:hypothetical protein
MGPVIVHAGVTGGCKGFVRYTNRSKEFLTQKTAGIFGGGGGGLQSSQMHIFSAQFCLREYGTHPSKFAFLPVLVCQYTSGALIANLDNFLVSGAKSVRHMHACGK